MEKEVFIFGHKNPDTDSICASLVSERLEKRKGLNNRVAKRLGKINKETQYVLDYLKIEAPEMIDKVEEGQEVCLVDHNEFNQSIEGIEKAKILSVTDHHRIANFETSEPLYYTAKPYGCTCTILFEEYKAFGYKISKEEAILMASAIISDTLLLKSPTTTEKDKKALEELEKLANVDKEVYGLEMLKAGTNLDKYTEKELINLDAKMMESQDLKYMVAQVNTVSIPDVLKRKEKIEKEIQDAIKENDLSLFVFVVTDIVNSNSEAIVLGDRTDLISKTYEINDNIAVMPGVVSRKKQITPVIEKNI